MVNTLLPKILPKPLTVVSIHFYYAKLVGKQGSLKLSSMKILQISQRIATKQFYNFSSVQQAQGGDGSLTIKLSMIMAEVR